MCVIAVSRSGSRLPTTKELHEMWVHNPHGAGFMFARSGSVHIHKGFMTWRDFITAVRNSHMTKHDSVVFHFRISTQAGRTPEMTHPFPLTNNISICEKLDIICPVGVAHNGIIPVTSNPSETRYSDTVLFITEYMSKLIKSKKDLTNSGIIGLIEQLCGWSKFAVLDGSGEVYTIGDFTDDNGILLSNTYHKIQPVRPFEYFMNNYSFSCK